MPIDATLDGYLAVLWQLAGTDTAVILIEDVPERLGIVPGEASVLLAEFARTGLVELWPEHPKGPALVLSTVAADALGLEMISAGRDLVRWVPAGAVRPLRAKGLVESDLAGAESGYGFDHMPDRRAIDTVHGAPPEEAYREEELYLARPRLILGLGVAWPVERSPDEPCPGCGGKRLPSIAACLICDRSGLDWRLPNVSKPTPRRTPKADGMGGGTGGRKPRRQAAAVA